MPPARRVTKSTAMKAMANRLIQWKGTIFEGSRNARYPRKPNAIMRNAPMNTMMMSANVAVGAKRRSHCSPLPVSSDESAVPASTSASTPEAMPAIDTPASRFRSRDDTVTKCWL